MLYKAKREEKNHTFGPSRDVILRDKNFFRDTSDRK